MFIFHVHVLVMLMMPIIVIYLILNIQLLSSHRRGEVVAHLTLDAWICSTVS